MLDRGKSRSNLVSVLDTSGELAIGTVVTAISGRKVSISTPSVECLTAEFVAMGAVIDEYHD
ncbi:hypothetical protein [Nocardia sp. CNY236]|uniref:hypothetical protein n=1 Tax=Nocardia sp. CNY236 TaxID=1169152 RepID=UPI000402344F|nr:hypothetical protein [Nocardia sp. CNY236]